MGVDVRMYVLPATPLTDQQRRRLSGDLAATIGHDFFWIKRPDDESTPIRGDVHALNEVVADPDDNEDGSDYRAEYCGFDEIPVGLLEVSTMSRYYGHGYERGDWLCIKATAEFLERHLPGCVIWYGGDSSDRGLRFTSSVRDDIHAHFLTSGHAPYRGYQGPWNHEPIETCRHCGDRPMNNVGGGGATRFYSCDGCGYQLVTHPLGNRVVPKDGDFFSVSRNLV